MPPQETGNPLQRRANGVFETRGDGDTSGRLLLKKGNMKNGKDYVALIFWRTI